MRDLFKALRSIALADTPISGLVETRVWVNKIPKAVIEAEDTRHPQKMLVLRQGGGGAKRDIMPLVDTNVIALCYGETPDEANDVLLAVTQRFTLLAREFVGDVLVHHINPTGGPIPSTEPDLVWPAVAQSFTVKADLLEV